MALSSVIHLEMGLPMLRVPPRLRGCPPFPGECQVSAQIGLARVSLLVLSAIIMAKKPRRPCIAAVPMSRATPKPHTSQFGGRKIPPLHNARGWTDFPSPPCVSCPEARHRRPGPAHCSLIPQSPPPSPDELDENPTSHHMMHPHNRHPGLLLSH
jgi:hypothetical protein